MSYPCTCPNCGHYGLVDIIGTCEECGEDIHPFEDSDDCDMDDPINNFI